MTYSRLPATRLTSSLPALIVISSLFVAIAAGCVATVSFSTQSHRAIEDSLAIQARSKRNEVRAFLTSVSRDLVGAAGNALIVHALDNIASSFKIMAPEARAELGPVYRGDTGPSTTIRSLSDYYGRAHDTVNPLFQGRATAMGYGDVLFLDPQGNIAYSLAKRSDFGTNVHNAALDGSVMAALFDQARTQQDQGTTVTDFKAYGPAGGPVALMATPVYDQSGRRDLIGVLVFELPRNRLDATLADGEGVARTAVTFLVGADGRLRSTVRTETGETAPAQLVDPALIGPQASGHALETVAFGAPMIAVSEPLGVDPLDWTVVAAEDTAEASRPVQQMIALMVGTSLVATLLLAWLAATLATRLAHPVVTLIERFDAALSNMPHGLVLIDGERRMILCNTAYREMYDLPLVLAKPGTPLASIDAYRRAQGMMPAEGSDWSPEGERRELLDGRTIDVIRSPLPSGGGYVATHLNVTSAVRAQQQITFLATHDALTGLPNRASLGTSLTAVLGQLRAGETLAVLSIDLDDFKPVNDALGHAAGDLLLKAASLRMGADLPAGTVLARLGGDEFAALLTGIGSPEEARGRAQALIETMAVPFEIDGHTIITGLSIGIAMAPTDGLDADHLIKNADLALHRAKADGRGTARFFEPAMDAKLQERRRLELDLRNALAHDQFELAYQPLYDARDDLVTGVEALIRWHHPERGIVSPAEFIPLAEERGLIVPIGEWVIRRACSDAAAWAGAIRVAVNLSAIQLKSPALVDTIARALADTGLAAHRLELEITESVLLSDDEATLATLHALKALGLRIAMDDFGTGYSSLSYLRSFPFDKIKIDQSFVRELNTRSDSVAIIRAISDLGTTLGMTTTVEGIETWEQLQIVRKQGCTEVQGYFMCRPCGVDAIARILTAREELSRQSA